MKAAESLSGDGDCTRRILEATSSSVCVIRPVWELVLLEYDEVELSFPEIFDADVDVVEPAPLEDNNVGVDSAEIDKEADFVKLLELGLIEVVVGFEAEVGNLISVGLDSTPECDAPNVSSKEEVDPDSGLAKPTASRREVVATLTELEPIAKLIDEIETVDATGFTLDKLIELVFVAIELAELEAIWYTLSPLIIQYA